jgi:hypothetical protein
LQICTIADKQGGVERKSTKSINRTGNNLANDPLFRVGG